MTNWNTSDRVWQIGLLILLGIAALIYIPGYDYGLPYLERKDEGRNLFETFMLRGDLDEKLSKSGYPPGILWVYESAENVVEAVTGEPAIAHPGQVVRYVRMAALVVIFTGIVATGLSARQLGGNFAGWLAMAVWFSSPSVTPPILVGYPQAWEFMFYGLTLYFALRALKQEKPIWAILSVAFGLGAVVFKYVAFPILGFGVGVALWYSRTQPKRWLKVLGIQIVLIGITAVLLFSSMQALIASDHDETSAFFEGGIHNIINIPFGLDIMSRSLELIDLPLVVFALLMAAGTIVYWRSVQPGLRAAWLVLLGILLFNLWSVTTYLVFAGGYHRYTVPSSSYMAVLAAVAGVTLAQWAWVRFRWRWLTAGIVTVLLVVWLLPALLARVRITQMLTWPITPLALSDWAAKTLLESDEIILIPRDVNIFTPITGGYRSNLLPLLQGAEPTDKSIDEWRAEGVYYIYLTREHLAEIEALPNAADYLDNLTLLKEVPSPADTRSWRHGTWRSDDYDPRLADLFMFWTGRIQHETNILFGDQIRLMGYDLAETDIRPGDTITLRLFWQAKHQPTANYQVYNHLMPLDTRGAPLAQFDGQPARNAKRPTATWDDPYEIIVSPDYALQIPPDLPAGEYRLMIGLYDLETGQRLLTNQGDDFFQIAIQVSQD